MIDRNSAFSLDNKQRYIYIEVVWIYEVELGGCAKLTNVQIIRTVQNEILRTMTRHILVLNQRKTFDMYMLVS